MTETQAPPIKRVETMEQAVEQGAAFLDVMRPGWEKTVRGAMTEGLFSMRTWDACVAGTLELFRRGSTGRAMIAFNGLSFPAYDKEPRWLGFLPLENEDDDEEWDIDHEEPGEDEYRKLDRLWREQVERRLPDATRPGP
jgi:hypothetical protein